MIKLQVKSTQTNTVKWNDKTTGQPRSMELQTVLVFLPNSQGHIDETPDKIEVPVNNQPLQVGIYTLTPQCIYLDRNRRLAISLDNIQPVQKSVQAAA